MKTLLKSKSIKIIAFCFATILVIGIGWWLAGRYLPHSVTERNIHAKAPKRSKYVNDPLMPAVNNYAEGRFKDAEADALRVIESAKGSDDKVKQKNAVRARYILAFSAARRKNLKLARERFETLRIEAAKLPDRGKIDMALGQPNATLEEEGAYQHAVCTAALDKEAGEAEYIEFMRKYPESVLIHGAIQRIERLHDGHCPAYAEDEWTRANNIALAREASRNKAKMKEYAMCGPESLAELLRRYGIVTDSATLAKEMKTNEQGTSLFALSQAANKYGLKTKGLSLTDKGLRRQHLPIIVLIMGNHYVILQSMTDKEVTIWDAYAKGPRKPGTMRIPIEQWTRIWSRVALVAEPQKHNL